MSAMWRSLAMRSVLLALSGLPKNSEEPRLTTSARGLISCGSAEGSEGEGICTGICANSSSASTSSRRCVGSTGADPRFEIGGITEVAAGRPDCPALLFDQIKGFPRGFRIFTNATTSPQRAALALGIDPSLRPLDALKAWMEKRKTLQPREPVVATSAAYLENRMAGAEVDLVKFPAPVWHRHDGGPFIGSGSIVIMRDPRWRLDQRFDLPGATA